MTGKENENKKSYNLKQDLIADDSAYRPPKDTIGHKKIVEQLAELVMEVETPTNIALYGPWGSGKTTIGALLKEKLECRKKSAAFIRVDTFKYVDLSLRRNFIKKIAKELNNNNFIEKIKGNSSKKKLDITSKTVNNIRLSWLTVPIGILILLSYFMHDKIPAVLQNIPMGVLLTLAGLKVTENISSPKEEDEFEEIFEQIIKKSRFKRLVIFVDELDRCSAKDMVKTLDSIRTFFDIEKCVIIIAADRNVLETALEQESQQATPIDEENPYYSTGGAYLDKVFRYQINIPPFWENQGVEYAISLIKEEKTGLWGELQKSERDTILDILIPGYVVSPRRVKSLLNSFALLYRLAENEGLISDNNNDIKVVARLACLKVEFPNFARDMLKNSELPNHVLMLKENPNEQIEKIDDNAVRVAREYAENRRSAVKIISKTSLENDNKIIDEFYGKRLISYLSNTRNIGCPTFSLLYLDSTFKDSFGLRALVTENFFNLAKNNEIGNFISELQKLNEEDSAGVSRHIISRLSDEKSRSNDNIVSTILTFQDKLLYSKKVDIMYRDLFVEKVLILAAQDNSETLNRDNVCKMWKVCDNVSTWQSYILRSYIIERCNLLNDMQLDDIDFLFDDIDFMFSIAPESALGIIVKMLYTQDRNHVIRKIFKANYDLLVEILPQIIDDILTAEDSAFIRNILREIAVVSLSCGRDIIEVIVLRLIQIEFQISKDAIESILFSKNKFNNSKVLSYVFKNVLKVPFYSQFAWLQHIDSKSVNEDHVDILIKLYVNFMTDLRQINRPDFADMEQSIYSFIDGMKNDKKDEVRKQIIDQIGLNIKIKNELTNANVIKQYETVLGKRGIMDRSEQVEAFMKRVLGAIESTVEGIMPAMELEKFLGEIFEEGEFDSVKSDISGIQIETLLYSLMRCKVLDPSLRFAFISIVSEAISNDSVSSGEQGGLPSIDRINNLLEHYGGLAVKPSVEWVRLYNDPLTAARIFYTLFVEGLLSGSGFAESLYRHWRFEEMSAFWTECFKYVGFHFQNKELIRAFALNKVSGDDKEALVNWFTYMFDCCKDIRQREFIVKLWESANIGAETDRIKSEIIIPLLEQNLDVEGDNFSSILLGITAVDKLLPKGFVRNDSDLRNYLSRVLDKTPELWMPIGRIMQPV